MKILYVTTIGSTMNFFNSFLKQLIEEGNTVDIATNERVRQVPDCYREWGCKIHQIDSSRSPLDKGNLKAVKQLKTLVEKEKYDLVHCHTPVAAMCTRFACRKARKNGTKVIYTAHGFHFYKGAPLKNWLIYYPVERLLAPLTDCLITINREDYTRAKSFRFKGRCRAEYVPGVGIDTKKFKRNEKVRAEMRNELGIGENETVLLSVGELNQNKNHKIVIEALAKLGRKDLRYIICGRGPLLDSHLQLAKSLGIEDQVTFTGYRADIDRFYQAADIFVISSFREGLPVAPMEAMAAGLPCIASKIRGNIDLFSESELLFDPANTDSLISAIKKATDKSIAKQETEKNAQTLVRFSTEEVVKAMKEIYLNIM